MFMKIHVYLIAETLMLFVMKDSGKHVKENNIKVALMNISEVWHTINYDNSCVASVIENLASNCQ